jgi:hypothetical protein
MTQLHKEYDQAFVLEPTKLTRLVSIIHERLADHANTSTHDTFDVFLTGGRREGMTTLDDVLALDNSKRRKIQRLVILSSASTAVAARPEHEIQVDFAGPKASSTTTTDGSKVVAISVRSEAAGWSSRVLSEVEEQVERTRQRLGRPLIALVALLSVGLVVLTSQFVSLRLAPEPQRMWLGKADLDRLEVMLAERPTLTGEDLREIASRQLRNILDAERPRRAPPAAPARRALFIAVPLAVVLGCALVLLTSCYPAYGVPVG